MFSVFAFVILLNLNMAEELQQNSEDNNQTNSSTNNITTNLLDVEHFDRRRRNHHSECSDIVSDEQCLSSLDPSYGSDSCDDNLYNSQDENQINNVLTNHNSIDNGSKDKDCVDDVKKSSASSVNYHYRLQMKKQQKFGNKQTQIMANTSNETKKDRNMEGAIGGASNNCDGDKNLNSITQFLCKCNNKADCLTLREILKSFNAPINEEQAWALIYQSCKLYSDAYKIDGFQIYDLRIPNGVENLNVHKDGTVHVNYSNKDGRSSTVTSHKKILIKLGTVVYTALDYNLSQDEECLISNELEELISHMTNEDNDDEGIERDSEDTDGVKDDEPEELDYVIEACTARVKPSVPEDHYKAVCRALVTEALELRIFLEKVFHGDTESLRIKASAETSKQELEKLEFNDWARFWMQVLDELRRGVRLKKSSCNYSRPSVEYELTPYEILMEDIRARKYNLRKVMVNGDIPPRVKKDAHALILEFIRSRPPLKKASERKLPPPVKTTPSAREQLMDSIRKGRVLKPTETRLKTKLLPTTQTETVKKEETQQSQASPRTRRRLIKVDYSLLQEDETFAIDESPSTSTMIASTIQMPSYPIAGCCNEDNSNNLNTVLRRTKHTITHDEYHRFVDNALESYDLATQCESRRASMRRHSIVGCQNNHLSETHSVPPSRPDSRQSDVSNVTTASTAKYQQHPVTSATPPRPQKHKHNANGGLMSSSMSAAASATITSNSTNNSNSNLSSMETWTKTSLDENQWADKLNDRLSLTLEEIVHIRSVMTKAELEGLPVGVRIKEDVERRKVCFLCLRTRFSIFGPWGIQCKLCQRTVCSKCYTKMRIPTEHFRNVPVVLLSPSLMSTPVSSNTPSPSHHAHITTSSTATTSGASNTTGQSSIVDESFPKSLMERLMRPDSEKKDRKIRNSVGSAPSSPKHQRSTDALADISQNDSNQSIPKATKTGITFDSSATNGNCSSNKENKMANGNATALPAAAAVNSRVGIMSRSMEGPKSLPVQSPARPHSNSSTLDRKNRFARAFTLSSSGHLIEQKENSLRGELMAVCNDCRSLVLEIIRSSRQTRSSARNRALKNLTLDISPVYKRS